MNMPRGSDVLRWVGGGVTAFLLLAIGLSFLVATGVAGRWLLGTEASGLGAGLVWLVVALALFRRAERVPDTASDLRFLLAISGAVLAVRLLLWWAVPAYAQAGDCQFMLDAIRMLAREGCGDEVMTRLAGIYYDDYLWVGRSFPFLLPLARWLPGHEVETARILNLGWSLLHNALVYALARRVLDRKAARVAFAMVSVIPLHTWMTLDYTHQYFGAFLVLAGVVLLARPLGGVLPSWRASAAAGAVFGLVLLGLHVQSGIDKFMLLAAVGAFVLCVLAHGLKDPRVARMAAMLLVAAAVFVPVSSRFTDWLMQYRPLRMSSHPISFTARGWNLVTMGEYYGGYEQIDRVTPWPHKTEAMKSLILSQMAHEPARTLIELPVIKVAKYFLIGYATALEQQLAAAAPPDLSRSFKATRLLFAPLLLGCVLLGLWRRFGDPERARTDRLFTAAVPLLFCAVYVLAGETSPRYSFHVHGLLALLAAGAFVRGADPAGSVRARVVALAGWGAAAVAGLVALALFAPPLIRATAGPKLFADLRAAQDARGVPAAPDQTVFSAVLSCEAPAHAVPFTVPGGRAAVSLFLWPLDSGRLADARVEITHAGAVLYAVPARDLAYVQRISAAVTPGATGPLEVRITGLAPCEESVPLLRWGYLKADP